MQEAVTMGSISTSVSMFVKMFLSISISISISTSISTSTHYHRPARTPASLSPKGLLPLKHLPRMNCFGCASVVYRFRHDFKIAGYWSSVHYWRILFIFETINNTQQWSFYGDLVSTTLVSFCGNNIFHIALPLKGGLYRPLKSILWTVSFFWPLVLLTNRLSSGWCLDPNVVYGMWRGCVMRIRRSIHFSDSIINLQLCVQDSWTCPVGIPMLLTIKSI